MNRPEPVRSPGVERGAGTGAPAAGRRSFGPLLTTDGRLRFLDIADGPTIIFMVFQHIQLLFAVRSARRPLAIRHVKGCLGSGHPGLLFPESPSAHDSS
jgi:hypothetical protein